MVQINDIQSAKLVGFGKIFHPILSDMNLVVFEKEYGYQAICIDVLLDATGATKRDACENLIRILGSYVTQTIHNHNGDRKAAVEYIERIIFDDNDLKSQYYNRYRQAKHYYIIAYRIAKEKRARSIREALAIFWSALFPFFLQHIRFNLTEAVA